MRFRFSTRQSPRSRGRRFRILLVGIALSALLAISWSLDGKSKKEQRKEELQEPPVEMSATVNVADDRVIKPISRGLYGIHAAWVYNAEGLWDADAQQLRPEPLRLAIELRPGPVRFPGGIGADYYHWRDGIGPRESRPVRSHGSDKDQSRNGFGTHEYMEFCRRIGAEPQLMVNILKGTPEEAAEWVDYCNRPNNDERARNGSPQPFNVRLWEVGNEPYIKAWSKAQKEGQMSASEYADRFLRYAAAMRHADPNVRLMGVGGTNFGIYSLLVNGDWNKTLLERAGREMDFLAVHNAYTPVLIRKNSFFEVYRAMVTFPEHMRENFRLLNEQIERYAPADANRIKIAVTEWGPFFAPRKEEVFLDHSKTMGAALFVGAAMQVMLNADRVEIANFFKYIDWAFQGMLTHDGVPKPSYYALEMFTRHFGDTLVTSSTESPVYDFPKQVGGVDPAHDVPYLTTVASTSADKRKLYIIAVNRHFNNPIRTSIRLGSFRPARNATVWTLTAPSLDANNGPDLPLDRGIKWPKPAKQPYNSMFDEGRPGMVATQKSTVGNASSSFEIVIPARAVVSLELDRQ